MKKKNQKIIAQGIKPIIEKVREAVTKEKGPETRKPADPKRMAEAKRQIKDRIKELESQEARLLLKFLETWTEPTKEDQLNFLWKFMFWLKKEGYHIINGQTVFCFPLEKMVRFKSLK